MDNILNNKNKNIFTNKFVKFVGLVFVFIISFFVLKYVNKNIHIDALYMDDLYFWSFFGEGESFFEFCFPAKATTYRPIYWMLSYAQFYITKGNVEWYLTFNLLLNSLIATFMFYATYKLSKNIVVAGFLNLLYCTSYFAYYQIGQLMGVLESYALLFGIIIVYNLTQFVIKKENYFINLIFAHIFFILVIFTHERYIGLIVPIILAMLIKLFALNIKNQNEDKNKRTKNSFNIILTIIFPIIAFVLFMATRTFVLGDFVPTGTGRVDVKEGFSIANCMKYAIDQVRYIFGMNMGEDYLSAKNYYGLLESEKKAVIKAIIPILLSALLYVVSKILYLIKSKKINIFVDLIFLSSIAMCIASSSVTIRIEMRWIYISYALCLMYLAYMSGSIIEYANTIFSNKIVQYVFKVLIVLVVVAFFFLKKDVDYIYRAYYPNIYFFEDQDRMNNLANLTVFKEGRENFIGKKNVYILENKYNMSDFYAEWFYRPYKYGWDGKGTRIYFINTIDDIPVADRNNSIVVKEDFENRSYIRVQ